MRKLKRIITMAAMAGVVATPVLGAVPTFAESHEPAVHVEQEGNDFLEDGIVKIPKKLKLDNRASVPAATFHFSLEPGAAIAGTSTVQEVKAGIVTGATVTDVVFNNNEFLPRTEGAVEKDIEIDLSGVNFPSPGIYRYIITESGTALGVTNDPEPKKTIDVLVVEDLDDNKMKPSTVTLYEGEVTTAPTGTSSTSSVKPSGYTNTYETYNLEFAKDISNGGLTKGNETSSADMTEEFTYTLKITGLCEGMMFSTVASKTSNQTILTADSNGEINATFTLSDNDWVCVEELPKGVTYSVTEDAKDYTSRAGCEIDIEENSNPITLHCTDATSGTITKDIYTGYTNTRYLITPTGILNSVSTYIVGGGIVACGVAGIVAYCVLKRRKTNV